jgi:hypothetical protein
MPNNPPGYPSAGAISGPSAVSMHRRHRASVLATVSLLLAAPAVVAVGTGLLAAPGAAVGLVAAVLGLSGIRATRHIQISGRGNAIVGLVLGLVAVLIGALVVTGVFPWIDASTNEVARIHGWLDAHMPWATPEL